MTNQIERAAMTWPNRGAPRADYLSSSRKRLAPQLRYKGYILNSWGRKLAVVVDRPFFKELHRITPFSILPSPNGAEMVWLVYELKRDAPQLPYQLTLAQTVYSDFRQTLERINTPLAGTQEDFIAKLQARLNAGDSYGTPQEAELPPEIDAPISWNNDD